MTKGQHPTVEHNRAHKPGQAQEERFSLWGFATDYRQHRPQEAAIHLAIAPADGPASAQPESPLRLVGSKRRQTGMPGDGDVVRSYEEFMAIVDDVRAYLIEHRADTEEEQIAYGSALNRAVLGHARERAAFRAIIQDRLTARRQHHLRPLSEQYETMVEAVFAEVIGMNVLESVLRDKDDLEEVQVVGIRIYEVRNGRVRRSPYSFRSIEEVERLQQNLVLYNRDSIHRRKRWAEVSLPDGSRVTMTGYGYTREPTITIRFFPLREVALASLARSPYETMDSRVAALLGAIVAARLNVIIIGATNTGKSHLLKALIAEISDEQRIVTIEQRNELRLGVSLPDHNIVEFEAPDDDAAHSGEQAFRLALRQSPDRIILAEIRDQEANLYVRACTRGHMGSMTTAHVNTLEDVPDAITDMCMLDKRGMDPERLRRRIARFVTQIGIELRVIDGKRKIVRIGEIMEADGRISVRELVVYDASRGVWRQVEPFSELLGERIRMYAQEHGEALTREGWIES